MTLTTLTMERAHAEAMGDDITLPERANVKRKQDHRDRVMQDHLPMEWTWVS